MVRVQFLCELLLLREDAKPGRNDVCESQPVLAVRYLNGFKDNVPDSHIQVKSYEDPSIHLGNDRKSRL
jgi:hypothetical protein